MKCGDFDKHTHVCTLWCDGTRTWKVWKSKVFKPAHAEQEEIVSWVQAHPHTLPQWRWDTEVLLFDALFYIFVRMSCRLQQLVSHLKPHRVTIAPSQNSCIFLLSVTFSPLIPHLFPLPFSCSPCSFFFSPLFALIFSCVIFCHQDCKVIYPVRQLNQTACFSFPCWGCSKHPSHFYTYTHAQTHTCI